MKYFEYCHLAALISAVLSACLSTESAKHRGQLRVCIAIVSIAYGGMWIPSSGVLFLWSPHIRVGGGLLGALIFIIIGLCMLRGFLMPFTNALFVVATLLLIQSSQLRLYVHGSRGDFRGWHPTLWALQTGILVALIIGFSRLKKATRVERKEGSMAVSDTLPPA